MAKFTPKQAKKPAPKTGKTQAEPSAEVGKAMFLKSLINLPFRALNLVIGKDDEGNDITLNKSLVGTLKEIPFSELFDLDNPSEVKNLEYAVNRFQTSLQYNPGEFFKKSGQLFIDELSE